MKKPLFFLSYLITSSLLNGQDLWEREYSVHSNTSIFSAVPAPTGEMYMSISGYINNLESSEVRLLKLAETGEIIWSKELRLYTHDWLGDIHVTHEESILCGNYLTDFSNGNFGFGITSLNSNGELNWFKAFSRNLFEGVLAIEELSNGEFVAVSTDRELEIESVIIQFDSTGEDMSFNSVFVQNEPVMLADARPAIDSEAFYVAGDVFDQQLNRQVALIARINNQTVEWSKTYDIGLDLYEDYGVTYIRVLPTGEVAIGLSLEANSDFSHALLLVDSDGEFLWAKGFIPNPNSSYEWVVGMETDPSGNIYYSFYSYSGSPFSGLTKWDNQGNLLHSKMIQDSNQKTLFYETKFSDGRMLMTGSNSYGPLLAVSGENGDIACGEIPWEGEIADVEFITNEVQLSLSEIAINPLDSTLLILDESEYSVELCSASLSVRSKSNDNLNIYPNPSNGNLSIEFTETGDHRVEIFSLTGEKLRSYTTNPNSSKVNLKIDLETGIYLLSVDNKFTEKIIIR